MTAGESCLLARSSVWQEQIIWRSLGRCQQRPKRQGTVPPSACGQGPGAPAASGQSAAAEQPGECLGVSLYREKVCSDFPGEPTERNKHSLLARSPPESLFPVEMCGTTWAKGLARLRVASRGTGHFPGGVRHRG